MPTFNTGLPSVRQIQAFIKDKVNVQIGLITSQSTEGKILWQDENCLCILEDGDEKTLIWLSAIAYIKQV
ncbi:MAG: Hfq-related RNA-binding protein [Cyanobacterium sp.]